MPKLLDREPTPEMLKAGELESYNEEATCETVFLAMYDAAPEVVQEPVAHVYRNEHGTVRIDQQYLPSADSFPVFAYPPEAQAAIRERDVMIEELLRAVADHVTVRGEQAAEISRLTALVDTCKAVIDDALFTKHNQSSLAFLRRNMAKALAAIKEIEK